MAKEKATFKDFITSVSPEHQEFVKELHNRLIQLGCDLVIKEAKSGYTATYQFNKKTVMNWVFRKAGICI